MENQKSPGVDASTGDVRAGRLYMPNLVILEHLNTPKYTCIHLNTPVAGEIFCAVGGVTLECKIE